jgi:hypothetical protein
MDNKRSFWLKMGIVGVGVVAIAVLLLVGLQSEEPVARSNSAVGPTVPFVACIEEVGSIAGDTPYLLVDLSDTTNWPHTKTSRVIIKDVQWYGSISGANLWHSLLGVVTENDATDGSVVFVHNQVLTSLSGMFISDHVWPEHGVDLHIVDGIAENVASNIVHDDNVLWANTNAITATMGTTGTVGIGDLILYMDERTDGSTANFTLCIGYDTE